MRERIDYIYASNDESNSNPQHNLSQNYLKGFIETKTEPINLGNVGKVFPELGLADSNIGSGVTVTNLLKTFTHWYSGGEFTIPYSGTSAVVYSQKGKGAILGTYPFENAPSIYKLTHTDNLIPEDTETTVQGKFTGGQPLDTIEGDQGFMNADGYSYGMLSGGPVFLSANPFSAIQFFDQDDLCKLNTRNYIHNTGQGFTETRNNFAKNLSNTHIAGSKAGGAISSFEYNINHGSIGNFITYNSQNNLHINLHEDGSFYTKSNKDIFLSTGLPPKILENQKFYDPNNLEEDIDEPEQQEFNYLEEGRISQEPYYNNFSGSKYYKGFVTDNVDQTFSLRDSLVHLRDDGSICLMGKGGSTIEMSANGDVYISAKRNLIFKAGRNIKSLAGNEHHAVSKNNMSFRSTERSLNITSLRRVQVFSELEGVHLQTSSVEDGITMKAPNGPVDIIGRRINKKATDTIFESTKQHKRTCEQSTEDCISKLCDYGSYGLKSDGVLFDIKNSLKIQSNFLTWLGTSFVYQARGFGIIKGNSPIVINHEHRYNNNWKTVNCKLGCMPVIIKDPDFNIRVPKTDGFNVSSVKITDEKDIEFEELPFDNMDVFSSPWQLEANAIWASLGRKVREEFIVFPNTYPYKVFDGNNFIEKEWSNYAI